MIINIDLWIEVAGDLTQTHGCICSNSALKNKIMTKFTFFPQKPLANTKTIRVRGHHEYRSGYNGPTELNNM